MKYKSKVFFTADLHFDHADILKYCNRPWKTVEEMNQALIDNWNKIVPRGSTVFILGDFAYKNHKKFAHKLTGKKILITGNHDKMNQDAKSAFTEVHEFGHRRNFFKQSVTMCHYSMNTWQNSTKNEWQLYGHSHGRIKEVDYRRQLDVGVDVWNYQPVPFEVIKFIMDKKKQQFGKSFKELQRIVDENKQNHLLEWAAYENNVSR